MTDWKALERSLRNDTFYEPVALEELTQIVRGLNFCKFECFFSANHFLMCAASLIAAHTGHFYKCPNGHVFVITEVSHAQ